MWTATDIYLLGVWQTMGPNDPDVLGQLQPHARFWMRVMLRFTPYTLEGVV